MSFAAHIITAYPDMFPGPLGESLQGRALADGLWRMTMHDLRDFGVGKHQNIDDTPAGGGPGMVLRADVAAAAVDHVTAQNRYRSFCPARVVSLSPNLWRKNGPRATG